MLSVSSSRMTYSLVFVPLFPVPYPAGSCLAAIGALAFFFRSRSADYRHGTAGPFAFGNTWEFASWLAFTNFSTAQTLHEVYFLHLPPPLEKINGENACWRHYFNDFIGVLLLLSNQFYSSEYATKSDMFSL